MIPLHRYASETGGRKSVPLFLAAASIGFTWFLNTLFSLWNFVLPWWIEGPSVLGFYGLFYTVFDKKLWKVSLIRRTLKLPNLNGSWKGYVSSSYDNFQSRLAAEMEICQTWTSMSISMKTAHSNGRSLTSMLVNADTDETTLNYEYLNEPKISAPISMQMHRGTALLSIDKDVKTLEGEYYTGRGRINYGLLHFERVLAKS